MIDQENRGFFEEPDFGFNSGGEKFFFPGDQREDIPMLPEIENRENREPELYYQRPKSRPYYGPRTTSPAYGHLYHKGMSYRNPMDHYHDPHEVEIFSHESLTYDHYPIKKSFQEYEEQDPYFQDIPKINAIEDRSLNPMSQRLKRYPEPEPKVFKVPYKADYEHDYEPHFDYPEEISEPHFKYPEHSEPHFNYPEDHKVRYRSIDYVPKQEHVQPKFQSLNLEPNLRQDPKHGIKHDIDFPAYEQVGNYHHEPNYVADMPHLPPPPEMLELQKNSLFPVDVPKIGVDAPYRPPELIFDELHRRNDDYKPPMKPVKPLSRRKDVLPYTRPRPSLKKFSDLDIVSNQEQASSFAPPLVNFDQEDETEWEFPQMPHRLNQFTESPTEQFEDFHQEKEVWRPNYR